MLQRQECINKLATFKQQYAQTYGITSLGLFGSVARGENTDTSDVDVVVEIDNPTLVGMDNLREHLKSLFGCKVDVVRFRATLRPLFKLNIQRDAVYV